MSEFAASWLALREPADEAARAWGLARRFAGAMPRGRTLRLLDLGAGTGANARALAPLIAVDQDWHLVERDTALLGAQAEAFGTWAQCRGYAICAEADAIAIEAAGARWRFFGTAHDLAGDWSSLPAPIDGVAAAAFFDLVSAAWLGGFARWLAQARLPLLAALTVDGKREWLPPTPEDAIVAAAFRRHQQRDKGFGPALGAGAAAALAQSLAAAGCHIAEQPSEWRIGAGERHLLAALVAGEAAAARAADPASAQAIARWAERRRGAAAADKLALVIGHRDLLALPAAV
ncbi:MAG TPA: class I SAM-dependent methyltransferase [Stellaceae bacterium]|nr:class I SAM-dependent methyltransferase [Stellaceae bacterium]